ncbi:26S proteasome non-ATPase regulatory subunit 10-like isoform X1 [Argonauta hians]
MKQLESNGPTSARVLVSVQPWDVGVLPPMASTVNFDFEKQMSLAISSNNLNVVHQLISGGMSVDSVLHIPGHPGTTTILGEACFAGSLEIVCYLLKAGAHVNYPDPCYSRTALHRACIGCQEKIAMFLIKNKADVNCKNKADVNCVDRDNVSPILLASMTGCPNIVKCLINHGADPYAMDRLRASAIHYATFYGHSEVISSLIRIGCNSNNSVVFGHGTPLANLVHKKDKKNCKLLLESGYKLDNENWLLDLQKQQSMITNNGLNSTINIILNWLQTPRSLSSYCRTVIRRCMHGAHFQDRISSLPIPDRMQNYLMFL